MFSFTLNNYEVGNRINNTIIESHNFDNPPSKKIVDIEVANRQGKELIETKYIETTLICKGIIYADTSEELDLAILELKEAMLVDNEYLIFLHEGEIRQYNVITKTISFTDNKRLHTLKSFYLEFTAIDPPFMLNEDYTIAKSEIITNQIYHDPLVLEGTAEPKPLIKLEFVKASTLETLYLINKSTGSRLHIENAFVDGDTLKVDTEKQKVTLNGEMIDYQSLIPSFITGNNYVDILTLSKTEGMQYYDGNKTWNRQFIVYGDKWLDQFVSIAPMMFVPMIDIVVSKVGDPTDLIVDIMTDDGGGNPEVLLSSAVIPKDEIFEKPNWINVLFEEIPQVYEAYHIVIRTDGGDDENYYNVKYADTDEFADGNLKRSLDGGENWINYPDYDLAFSIYKIEIDQNSAGSYIVENGLAETFDTTTYKDAENTDADWNTAQSKLKMFNITDQNQSSYNNAYGLLHQTTYYAMSFKVSTTDDYDRLELYLKAALLPDDNLYISIRTDNDNMPSSTEIGSGMLEKQIISDFTWKAIYLTMSQQLNSGTQYWIVMKSPNQIEVPNRYLIRLYVNSYPGDIYPNGRMVRTLDDEASWQEWNFGFNDLTFKFGRGNIIQYGYSLNYTASEKFPIVYAEVDPDTHFMSDNCTVYLSNDDGSTWQKFAQASMSTFYYWPAYFDNISNSSNDMRFKIVLGVTAGMQYTGAILNLNVHYYTAGVLDTTNYRLHNGFKPGFTGALERIDLLLKKKGSPGNLTVELYADSAGKPTGSALATQTIDASKISTTANWIQIKFDTPYSVTSGTTYHIVIKGASVDSSNMYMWFVADGNPYADGVAGYSSDGGSNWTNESDYDFNFRTYEGALDMEINIEAKHKKRWL